MVTFLFIDDAFVVGGDAENYRRLLHREGELEVSPMLPNREALLVPENELPANIDGFIFDINLRDIPQNGHRFIGTGAGFAQDIRLLQTAGGEDGQRPRPIVRLCADQVFQRYLAGADSTVDVFDLGFSKETIGDIIGEARQQIASLPDLYAGIADAAAGRSACELVGLDPEQYAQLHSAFRSALELELTRKHHEAANFFIRFFLKPAGVLIAEDLLAVRLGVDASNSPGWQGAKELFSAAEYSGRAASGFPRWWSGRISEIWAALNDQPLYKLSSLQRVEVLQGHAIDELAPMPADPRSPGDRPWNISRSEDPDLVLPADPRFSYTIMSASKPWLDEVYWCLEQAKRNRDAVELPVSSRQRLQADLKRMAAQPR